MSVISATTICNKALVFLGESTITTFPEDSVNSDRCEIFYDYVKASELSKHPWNFATFREALTRDGTNPINEYGYQFVLPANLLRVLHTYPRDMRWRLENTARGKRLLTHDSTVSIMYLKNVGESEYTDLFAGVCSAMLATLLAPMLTEQTVKLQMAKDWYDNALKAALTADSQEMSADQLDNLQVVTDRWTGSIGTNPRTTVAL